MAIHIGAQGSPPWLNWLERCACLLLRVRLSRGAHYVVSSNCTLDAPRVFSVSVAGATGFQIYRLASSVMVVGTTSVGNLTRMPRYPAVAIYFNACLPILVLDADCEIAFREIAMKCAP